MVWATIYDDGPAMGDRTQYREIVTKLYIEGIPAHEITYKDAKGKLQRLAPPPSVRAIKTKTDLNSLRELAMKLKEGQAAARDAAKPVAMLVAGPDVESDPDG